MNYGDLEEVYGGAFQKRVPISSERRHDSLEKPLSKSMSSNQKDLDAVVKEVAQSANIDNSAPAEGFRLIQEPMVTERMKVREKFTESQPAGVLDKYSTDQMDKISRILRLVEQNKTGYERPATQDILLYVFTGVFFLFTLDTFVMLGKSMRGK